MGSRRRREPPRKGKGGMRGMGMEETGGSGEICLGGGAWARGQEKEKQQQQQRGMC